jgi:hypothetical protein
LKEVNSSGGEKEVNSSASGGEKEANFPGEEKEVKSLTIQMVELNFVS